MNAKRFRCELGRRPAWELTLAEWLERSRQEMAEDGHDGPLVRALERRLTREREEASDALRSA